MVEGQECPVTTCCMKFQGKCIAGNPQHCLVRKLGPEVAANRISEGWQKFGWRGFSVITFCPGCMTPLLTEKQVLSIAKAFHSFNVEAIESVMQPIAAGFGIYIPGNEEIAQLTEHRVVIHPFCFTCSVHVGEPEFEERSERNIVLSRRFIERKRFRKAGA